MPNTGSRSSTSISFGFEYDQDMKGRHMHVFGQHILKMNMFSCFPFATVTLHALYFIFSFSLPNYLHQTAINQLSDNLIEYKNKAIIFYLPGLEASIIQATVNSTRTCARPHFWLGPSMTQNKSGSNDGMGTCHVFSSSSEDRLIYVRSDCSHCSV